MGYLMTLEDKVMAKEIADALIIDYRESLREQSLQALVMDLFHQNKDNPRYVPIGSVSSTNDKSSIKRI